MANSGLKFVLYAALCTICATTLAQSDNADADYADEVQESKSPYELGDPMKQVGAPEEDEEKALFNVAVEDRDWESARLIGEELAEEGDGEAQGVLGIMYYEGYDTPRDLKRAQHWLNQAVVNGFEPARALLGRVLIETGHHRDAKPHLEKAAAAGNAGSMLLLASMLAEGTGIAKDTSRAMQWLVKAGALDAVARRSIERVYPTLTDSDDEYSDKFAMFSGFFNEAVQSADRDDVLTIAKLQDRNKMKALQWYGIAAEQGSPEGLLAFGEILESLADQEEVPTTLLAGMNIDLEAGDGPARLMAEALGRYYSAAQLKHVKAMVKLARLVGTGRKVVKDPAAAFQWWSLANREARRQDAKTPTGSLANGLERARAALNTGDLSTLANAQAALQTHVDNGSLPPKPQPSTVTQNEIQYAVNGNSVNVRTGPGRNYRVSFQVNRGEDVQLINTHEGWSHLSFPGRSGQTGWIFSQLVVAQLPTAGNQVLTRDDVNLHSGPSGDSFAFLRLSRGLEIVILERAGDWLHVKLESQDETRGWIRASSIQNF